MAYGEGNHIPSEQAPFHSSNLSTLEWLIMVGPEWPILLIFLSLLSFQLNDKIECTSTHSSLSAPFTFYHLHGGKDLQIKTTLYKLALLFEISPLLRELKMESSEEKQTSSNDIKHQAWMTMLSRLLWTMYIATIRKQNKTCHIHL